ncbi:MAG: hypothetical protein AMXMBFR82_42880 [Candidatus Hydrogenedentota bacterium]
MERVEAGPIQAQSDPGQFANPAKVDFGKPFKHNTKCSDRIGCAVHEMVGNQANWQIPPCSGRTLIRIIAH